MVNPISSFIGRLQDNAESIHENIDPAYRKQKKEVKEGLQKVGLMSTAALATSVALATLGICCLAIGGAAAFVSIPMFFVSLPLGYLAYNAYRISENLNQIIENPKKYQVSFGLVNAFDKHQVKIKLKENTFGFGWVIDAVMDHYAKNPKSF
ncbi:MAG TPA: hypothetical protein VGP47_09155 [Parachlamydiaceae bacterium]|nr:hypothetical protein [Parachlamydiaceae bacterium]